MSPVAERAPITACMIVRDEQERLPAALESVAWCDHVVVVDSESVDGTVAVATASGATVVVQPWLGFGAQRNVALDHAESDWVIEVDADERVSAELRADIERFLAMPPPADVHMCVIPLRHRLLGRSLGPSAQYPLYRARMFRRSVYRHDDARRVHEGLWPKDRVWALRGDLHHELASSWGEALGDVLAYARLESLHVAEPGSPMAYVREIALRPLVKTLFRLIVDGGWRDGWRGLVRIALDAVADSLTFGRRALGRIPPTPDAPGVMATRALPRIGSVRIVVLDRGSGALGFLRSAYAAGADVALITAADVDAEPWLHVRRVPRMGPLHLLRAVRAVQQMRPIDQLVVGSVRVPARLLDVGAMGVLPPARLAGTDPATLVRRLVEVSRPSTQDRSSSSPPATDNTA